MKYNFYWCDNGIGQEFLVREDIVGKTTEIYQTVNGVTSWQMCFLSDTRRTPLPQDEAERYELLSEIT